MEQNVRNHHNGGKTSINNEPIRNEKKWYGAEGFLSSFDKQTRIIYAD